MAEFVLTRREYTQYVEKELSEIIAPLLFADLLSALALARRIFVLKFVSQAESKVYDATDIA